MYLANPKPYLTKIETVKLSYEWKIENFFLNNKKTGEALQSPTFTIPKNNLKWCIMLFPEERYCISNCEDIYISLYLCNLTENSNHKVQFELSIIHKDKQKVNKSSDLKFFNYKSYIGFKTYIKKNVLLREKATLLPDDSLTIGCDIAIGSGEKHVVINENHTEHFKVDEYKEQIQTCEDLGNLFKSEEFADILITTSTKQLKAHKYILAARSPVFLAMFRHNMVEKLQGEIKINDFDSEVVREMLEFIYTGKVKNIEKNTMSLLSIADTYQLKGLINLCERFLNNAVSIKNAIDLLILADCHNVKDLKTKVIKFILLYKKEITKIPQFDDLKKKHPSLIVDLFCNE